MITSKSEYKYYIKCDEVARWGYYPSIIERVKKGKLWSYNVVLRRQEYNLNCRKGIFRTVIAKYYVLKKKSMGYKLGWFVPPNTFGPGLCIVHVGPVIVNDHSQFGSNCRVQAMVNIGANNGDLIGAPKGGNNVYFGPGAKIFGNIMIGSNVAIGANAVVNKSFEQNGITLAGVPAKIVSFHGTEKIIFDAVSYVNNQQL